MVPVWLTDTVTSNLDRALHYTMLWGLEAIELRTVGTPSDRVPHVNEEKLRRRLLEQEVAVAAVVPGLFEGPASQRLAWMNEVAALPETLRFCKRIGCTTVIASSFAAEEGADADATRKLAADALRRAGDAAARHGIQLAVLNDGDGAHPTAAALADLLAAADHPAVGAAWHPAAALRAGEAAEAGAAALGDRVVYVRATDARRGASGWLPLGEGDVGWPAVLQALSDRGYAGAVSLEVHAEPKPKQGLREATRLIQWLRQA